MYKNTNHFCDGPFPYIGRISTKTNVNSVAHGFNVSMVNSWVKAPNRYSLC